METNSCVKLVQKIPRIFYFQPTNRVCMFEIVQLALSCSPVEEILIRRCRN